MAALTAVPGSTATTAARSPQRPAGAASGPRDAFNAMVLKTMIEQMLPRQASHVYGKGTAGEIWRSFLAQQIADEVGRSRTIDVLAGRISS